MWLPIKHIIDTAEDLYISLSDRTKLSKSSLFFPIDSKKGILDEFPLDKISSSLSNKALTDNKKSQK